MGGGGRIGPDYIAQLFVDSANLCSSEMGLPESDKSNQIILSDSNIVLHILKGKMPLFYIPFLLKQA